MELTPSETVSFRSKSGSESSIFDKAFLPLFASTSFLSLSILAFYCKIVFCWVSLVLRRIEFSL